MSAEFWAAICSVVAIAAAITGWVLTVYTDRVLTGLVNPDGSPGIDEYVTHESLALSKICAELCLRIYSPVHDLPQRMTAGIDDARSCQVIHSPNLDVVCCIVEFESHAIVVFRGTQLTNRRQVLANAAVELVEHIPVGNVHKGLSEAFRSVHLQLMAELAPFVRYGCRIYVTGHSQGGGLAALTVALLRREASLTGDRRWDACGLFTFGSMRPGDDWFQDYVESAIDYRPQLHRYGILRFRNNNDLVTLLPRYRRGYRHVGRCLYIWPCGVITRSPGFTLQLLQRLKSWATGHFGEGVRDHAMTEYVSKLSTVTIPE